MIRRTSAAASRRPGPNGGARGPSGTSGCSPSPASTCSGRRRTSWHTDLSLRAGISFENVSILGRNLQVLAEYYKGRSFDGQFFINPVEYVGIGVHFNF